MPSYWITKHNTSSVKSPYAIRLTLASQPQNEPEIEKWLTDTFGKNGYLMRFLYLDSLYADIFFKDESDVTSFILRWGNSLD